MSPTYPVILFDLDGTLTDSAPGIIAGLHYAFDDLGIPRPDDATMRSHLGPPLVDTFRDFYGLDEEQAARGVAKYREQYLVTGLFENAVFDGIPELLRDLVASGATLAVATSKPTESAVRILNHFELADLFAFIGGAEMDGPRRHKADVVAHTVHELGLLGVLSPGEPVVMIGDRSHDILGAAANGIPGIGVLWGYGDTEELVNAGAIRVVADVDELRTALTQS